MADDAGIGIRGYRVQTVARPTTSAEWETVRSQMIDTNGRPLEQAFCGRCRGPHFTVEPHVDEVPSPRCGSTTLRCRRPSGHDAAAWHRERVDALVSLSDQLDAAGVPQVARWPTTPSETDSTS